VSKIKYYIGEIDTYFGESSVTTTIRFKTDIDPNEYLYRIASDFWGDPHEERDGLFDFGDKSACGGRWQEVDAKVFDALHILAELTHGEQP